jgi:hypothetical protein
MGDQIVTEKVWRNLALQFDEHRMLALAHLRRALDTGLQNRKEIELFLQSSPRSGNEISAEADTLRAEVARLLLALTELDKAASVVSSRGAQTGPQWSNNGRTCTWEADQ